LAITAGRVVVGDASGECASLWGPSGDELAAVCSMTMPFGGFLGSRGRRLFRSSVTTRLACLALEAICMRLIFQPSHFFFVLEDKSVKFRSCWRDEQANTPSVIEARVIRNCWVPLRASPPMTDRRTGTVRRPRRTGAGRRGTSYGDARSSSLAAAQSDRVLDHAELRGGRLFSADGIRPTHCASLSSVVTADSLISSSTSFLLFFWVTSTSVGLEVEIARRSSGMRAKNASGSDMVPSSAWTAGRRRVTYALVLRADRDMDVARLAPELEHRE